MADKITMRQKGHSTDWEYMYDGKAYPSKEAAEKAKNEYKAGKKTPKIETSNIYKKAKDVIEEKPDMTDVKRLAIRDIKKKFPEGHKAVVEKAKAKRTVSGSNRQLELAMKKKKEGDAKENKAGQKGAPKKSVGLNARQFKRIFDKEDTIVPVHLFELWEQEGYSEKQARDAWEKYKNK